MDIDISDLFEKYHNKIYRLALGITANEKDAEDIVQNTFLKIAEGRAPFKNLSSESTWVYRIAHNEALMHLRKRRSESRLSDAMNSAPVGLFIDRPKIPDREAMRDELGEEIDGVLASLPVQYRMPLILHKVEGMSDREAAAILKIKVNTFKTRLRRAVMTVADAISRYQRGGRPKSTADVQTCPLYTSFVRRYATGDVDAGRKRKFESHIADCPSCKSFLDSYGEAIRLTDALECSDMPNPLKEKLRTFIDSK